MAACPTTPAHHELASWLSVFCPHVMTPRLVRLEQASEIRPGRQNQQTAVDLHFSDEQNSMLNSSAEQGWVLERMSHRPTRGPE